VARKTDDEPIQTRVTLLNRLKDWRDQSSWQEFFDIYWKLIYGVARKAGLTETEAQDVVQETLFSVAKHIPEFKYDPAIGSFKGWLLNMTRWRIVDQLRKRGPVAEHRADSGETARTATIEKVADPNSPDLDALWEADWEKNLLDSAMTRVKTRLDPQKFQIFDFYVNKEWPPEKVAQTFKVSVNTVYLAKNRVTELLREEVRRLEKEVT
jgi:RNA polymerase sigma-70 factor (ECF subfamily)